MGRNARRAKTAAAPEGRAGSWRSRVRLRRTILAAVVLGQCAIATAAMLRVLPYHGGDPLEASLVILFSLLFFGISVGAWFGIYGFFLRLAGGDPFSLDRRHPEASLTSVPLARTAIVMPIYHEPIERTFAGIRAVYRSLAATGHLDLFDFFILSDSRDPEYWLAEQAAWYRLCRELGADGRIFYRRRAVNLKHKSGNIADFFRRWGRNYTYTMVLDADSLMGGETIVRMVRLMEVEPRIGILQSCPAIVNGTSLFARSQQFASRLYGPIFTSGLAALQLGEATYWGHNALIRSEPFMRHCGLKRLPGRGLFGGAILSHDFVEAACMGRAGYEVWLEPGLRHSYEESPPTLIEDLVRDRRWAKGNLQHLWHVLRGRNFRLAHRLAFVNGIMSYVASPLWLLFLILTGIEATRLTLMPIRYFPRQYSPFPVWPEWHPELAVTLISSTFVLLFLPKVLAVIDALARGRTGGFGGLFPLLGSLGLEIVISAMLAPVRMLAHSRFVVEALLNVNLKWAGQNRSGETSWRATLLSQLPGTVLAGAWAVFAYWLDPHFFLWSLPVVIPLLLAAPLSLVLGRAQIGQALQRFGLFVIVEEKEGNALLQDDCLTRIEPGAAGGMTAFEEAIIDPGRNGFQQAMARRHHGQARTELLDRLCRLCLQQGSEALTVHERSLIARDQRSLIWLHQAVWRAEKNSCWSSRLTRR